MRGHAPIVRLTLAWAAGVAAGLAGAPWWMAPLLVPVALTAPIPTSRRPAGLVWAGCAAAGLVAASTAAGPGACSGFPAGSADTVPGRLLATPRGGSAPFVVDGPGCAVTLVFPREPARAAGAALPRAGAPIVVEGRWQAGRRAPWLQARTIHDAGATSGPADAVRWGAVRWRDGLVGRLHRLYPRHGPLVSALVLARREGLDPELRSAFAVTGIAHLLAISGFHVGLIAGLLFGLLRSTGRSRRAAALGAAGGAWIYVAVIGFPDAAFRAALILTFVAVSRARGHPPSRWGPLASAGLVLLVLDPGALAEPGFQLSFAGAAGLVAWAGPLERRLTSVADRLLACGHPDLRIPRGLASALAAGVAATVATLPIVAWHFERVSLVGIPVTLVATPLVSFALPAALLTLGVDLLPGPFSGFLAGGVGWVLDALVRLTVVVAAWPWTSAWTSRPTVVAGCLGLCVATLRARSPGIAGRARLRLSAVWVLALVVGWPVLLALGQDGRLEIVMIDVGQGDALAVRTPRGRWLLVDAGPPTRDDPGGHPVVRYLRTRGVGRLESLVLTHPDLDHIGGADAVIRHVAPRTIRDPMLVAPKEEYADLVEAAAGRGIPWLPARAGDVLDLDGVGLRVLHPDVLPEDDAAGNLASVVLLLSWNGFDALLTGDAYVETERRIAPEVGDLDLLKVGHHGSRTSTDSAFLASARPELALIPVGDRNRYGHPAPEVVRRLDAIGARIFRTDRDGTVRVLVHRDGTAVVRTERRR